MFKKIEEAIQQRRFRNKEERLLVNFIYTFNWLKEYQIRLFEPFDLTLQQYNILRILRGSSPEPLNQKAIKRRMLDKMSDVSRLLKRLEKKNLVVCLLNSSDKRNLDVSISPEGLELLEKIDLVLPSLDKVFKEFKESDMKQLNELLDKMRSMRFPKPF